MPLVSVVIPAYNCAHVIREALDSVFAQSWPELEVFVVDDGSTDGTSEVVARYGKRVTLVQQKNAGAAVARNEGIRHATGSYIALLDADDLWLPGKLRAQVEHLERHPEVGLCCTRWELSYPDRSGAYPIPAWTPPAAFGIDPRCSGWIYHNLLQDCLVWTSTVVMRHQLAQEIGGFSPELRRGQDYDYWLRASRLTRIDRLDAALAVYRLDGYTGGHKFPDTNWELIVVSRGLERWGAVGPDGAALSEAEVRHRLWALNYRFGYGQFRRKRYVAAAGAFAAALRQRPMHLKTFAYTVASGLGRFAIGA